MVDVVTRKGGKLMSRKQRIGLSLILAVIVSLLLFNSKPDFTMNLWIENYIISTIFTGIGVLLLASK